MFTRSVLSAAICCSVWRAPRAGSLCAAQAQPAKSPGRRSSGPGCDPASVYKAIGVRPSSIVAGH